MASVLKKLQKAWRHLCIPEMKRNHVILFQKDTFYSACVEGKIIKNYYVSRYLHPEDGHMSGRNMSVVTM